MIQHRPIRSASALFLAAAILTSCTDTTLPIQAEDFPLVVVNDRPLPAPHPEHDVLEVVSGRLTLHADGTAEEAITIRCRPDLPPTTQCQVTQPTRTRTGAYSEADGWVSFDGRNYPAQFEAGRVTVEYGPPPSMGFFARATFVFAR
jgi:hypothetical protein